MSQEKTHHRRKEDLVRVRHPSRDLQVILGHPQGGGLQAMPRGRVLGLPNFTLFFFLWFLSSRHLLLNKKSNIWVITKAFKTSSAG
jgi:hypothetical protein